MLKIEMASNNLQLFSNICILLCFLALIIALATVVYRLARPCFPVRVNCWFCNKMTKVSYKSKNSWDCPYCEQYNGFSKDGGYNKEILAQHREVLSTGMSSMSQRGTYHNSSTVLCEQCNRSQLLKVKQLANFVPYNEANYDMEVENFKCHLEQIYRLCKVCQVQVAKVLQSQDQQIQLTYNITENCTPNDTPDSSFQHDTSTLQCSVLCAPVHVRLMRWSSLLCSLSLCITSLILLLQHSDTTRHLVHYIPRPLHIYCTALQRSITSVIVLGLIFGLIAIYRFGKHSVHICDALSSVTWLLCLFIHSKVAHEKLKSEDLFLLQAFFSTLNFIMCLWGTLCPRFEKSTSRNIRVYKKRNNVDGSPSPLRQSINQNTVKPNQSESVKQNNHQEEASTSGVANNQRHRSPQIDDKFETMKIGTASTSRLTKPSMFQTFQAGNSISGENQTHQQVRARKGLIHPAKFMPSLNTDNPDPGHDDEENKLCDERAAEYTDEDECQAGTSHKRSLCTKILLGVSLGLNIAIILYFVTDLKQLPEALHSYYDEMHQFFTHTTTQVNYIAMKTHAATLMTALKAIVLSIAENIFKCLNYVIVSLTEEKPVPEEV